MTAGGARVSRNAFAWHMTEALRYPVTSPLRLLAVAVIARWLQDGKEDEIGSEWAELAEVPQRWLVEAIAP